MADIRILNDEVQIGEHFSLSFQRTLRIPDDGNTYPLPPGLGRFPIRRIADYTATVPEEWRNHGGVFIPMYQREALWIRFSGKRSHPSALKVAVGKVNAITGKTWDEELHAKPQDYVVAPTQPWLDGINAGKGMIKQFVAMPFGMGYTVEGQVTGEERFGGIQILHFNAKPGAIPEEEAVEDGVVFGTMPMSAPIRAKQPMGIAAGGRMKQKIYPGPYDVDVWDTDNGSRLFVHIVNSEQWKQITGEEVPATPVDVHAYNDAGLPWFDLYDDGLGDVESTDVLENVKSVAEKDAEHGFTNQQNNDSFTVPDTQTHVIGKDKPGTVKDGDW